MSLLVSDYATKIPVTLRQDQRYQGGIVGRTTRNFTTSNDVYATNGISQVGTRLAALGYVDMPSMYWRGKLEFTQGLRLSRSIHSIFRRIQVRTAGGDIIADLDGANVLQAALQDGSLTISEAETTFALTMLTGTDSYRERIYSGVQFTYIPNLAITRFPKLLPLHLIGPLDFTFWLEDVNVAFEKVDQSLTNYAYQISNVECVCDIVSVSPEVESLYQRAYEQDQLSFPLTSWRMSPFQSNSAVEDLRIEAVNNSNRAIVAVPRLVSNLLNPNVDSFARTAQSLRYVQWSIGSNLLARYDCSGNGAQIMQEMQKTLDFSNNAMITPWNFHCQIPGLTAAEDAVKSSKFMVVQNLELSRTDESILSGSARIPITMSLEYSSQIQPTSWYCFVLHDAVLISGASQGTRVLS